MTKRLSALFKTTLHPFFLAVYPILALYQYNSDEITLESTLVPILVSLAGATVAFLIAWAAMRNSRKAALVVAVSQLVFFSYGHLFGTFGNHAVASTHISLHAFAVPTMVIFIGGAAALIRISKYTFTKLTLILNAVSGALVVSLLATIILNAVSATQIDYSIRDGLGALNPTQSGAEKPDIYYIILDGYPNSAVLKKFYRFDNSVFIKSLQDHGFYVADYSTSNYATTFLSLASSLNGIYLDEIDPPLSPSETNRAIPYSLTHNNAVGRLLQENGYSFINVASGTGLPTNDLKLADRKIRCGSIDEFSLVLIQTTLLNPFERLLVKNDRQNLVQCSFREIKNIPLREEPTFTLAHLLVPHPPYLFRADGSPIQNPVMKLTGGVWADTESFIEQIQFVNAQTEALIDSLLATSPTPPIIIIQADHSTVSSFAQPSNGRNAETAYESNWNNPTDDMIRERMGILNAFYLPNKETGTLYQTMTPVNTFRIVMNMYFGAKNEILEDRNFFSSYSTPYAFRDVTTIVQTSSAQPNSP
ncbi:MAG: hypothetical protein PHY34_05495 [Patescibacteria group bacterium]|nr:hypothetical protein [Patescibacteria group bacterium]MDD5715558.1 hypothetical protein [Patescibacteria group bacterium]